MLSVPRGHRKQQVLSLRKVMCHTKRTATLPQEMKEGAILTHFPFLG